MSSVSRIGLACGLFRSTDCLVANLVAFAASSSSKPPAMLGKAIDPLNTAASAILLDYSKSISDRKFEQLGPEEQQYFEQISQLVENLRSKNDINPGNMISFLRSGVDEARAMESPFVYLLMITAERNCHDLRDKIYAL